MDRLDQLQQAVEAIREDYNKAKGGNKAAGTRVRKAMQEIKNIAQQVRQEMLEVRQEA
ncbi:MAG: histone H1 [Planctomycetota bacterium]|nr:MAG: histone H1 [Planctomycetota bacterium]